MVLWLVHVRDAHQMHVVLTAIWHSISQILSPLLPAVLVLGQTVAAARLRQKEVYCVNLPRIPLSGKVRIFCFDKTGTLTKEGLDFYGVLVRAQRYHLYSAC